MEQRDRPLSFCFLAPRFVAGLLDEEWLERTHLCEHAGGCGTDERARLKGVPDVRPEADGCGDTRM